MNEKSKKAAAEIIKAIKAKYKEDVIKEYHIQDVADIKTAKDVGINVELKLNTKFDYYDNILGQWKEDFQADCYYITVLRNQLFLNFRVSYDKKGSEK